MMKRTETEIKFEVSPDLIDIFYDWIHSKKGPPSKQTHLKNIYFDTPTQTLRHLHAGLRVRQRDEQAREQTLKWLDNAPISHIKNYQELTVPIQSDQPDFKLFDNGELPLSIQESLADQTLQAYFCTDFIRQYWFVNQAQSTIKVTLDQGQIYPITDENAAHTICEIELELKTGSLDDLLDFAQQLIQISPMRLGYYTKAAFGNRVYEGYPTLAIKRMQEVDLSTLTQPTTLQAITLQIFTFAFDHIQYHEQCFFEQTNLSALIQVRNGFSMIHQALLLLISSDQEPTPPIWAETLFKIERYFSWLTLACAQERWCQSDGYRKQRWPHMQTFQQFTQYMQSQWPNCDDAKQMMQSQDYIGFKLTLMQWMLDNQNSANSAKYIDGPTFAAEKINDTWLTLHTLDTQTEPSATDLLKIAGRLRHHFMLNLCLGSYFGSDQEKQNFLRSWLDVLQGLEDLAWLNLLNEAFHEKVQNATILAELEQWFEIRRETLLKVIRASYQQASSLKPYWLKI